MCAVGLCLCYVHYPGISWIMFNDCLYNISFRRKKRLCKRSPIFWRLLAFVTKKNFLTHIQEGGQKKVVVASQEEVNVLLWFIFCHKDMSDFFLCETESFQ